MDYSTWAFLLLAIGITLLIAEVFIPSGGVISILAALSLAGSLTCAGKAWWSSSPGAFWAFISATAILLPVAVGAALYIWPSTPLGKRAILEGPAPDEVVAFVEQEQKYAQMVGKLGETVTTLNPAGIVRVDGHRIHCQSEGVIIEAGVPVRVVSSRANGVVVRRAALDGLPAERAEPDVSPPIAQPLDFDMS